MGMLANNSPLTSNNRNGMILHPNAFISGETTGRFYRPSIGRVFLSRSKITADHSKEKSNWVKYTAPVEINDKFRVLLIDKDQDETQKMAVTLTKNLKFCIDFILANSAEHALQKIETEAIDLIVFADNSVEMHGLEFLAQLNQKCGKAKIPLIEVFNPDEMNAGIEAMKMGAHDYLLRDTSGRHWEVLPILVSRIHCEHQRMMELQHSVGAQQTIGEAIPSVMYKLSLQGGQHEVCISTQLAKMGLTSEQWGSDTELHHQLCFKEDRISVRKSLIHSYISGENFHSEYRITTAGDNLRWVHDKAKIIMDKFGRPLYMQGIMTDITHAKSMESELALYRNMLEKMVSKRTERLDRRVSILEQCNTSLSENYSKLHQRYIELLSQEQNCANGYQAVAAA